MSGSQQLLLGGSVAVPVDPYFYSVTSLLHGDGTNGGQNNTFLDSSTNNFTITRNGNTTQGSFSPFSQTGWSNYFDGTGDYLDAGAQTAFAFGTGAWTVEAWVYVTTLQEILVFDTRSSVSTAGIGCRIDANGTLYYSGSANNSLTSNAINANAWNHVAWVYDGTTLSGYVNGIRGGTATPSFNISQNNGVIGRVGFAASGYMIGYISNLRVVKGSAVYSGASFTVPTTPLTAITNTSLLTCQSNRFRDASTNNFTITANGDVSVQPFSPFNPTTAYSTSSIGGSGYFDGSGDYLNVGSGTNNIALSGDFCIEAWIYRSSNADGTIIGNYNSSPNRGWSFRTYSSTNLYLYFQIDGGAETIYQTSAGSAPINQWMHLVWCRSGTNTSVFINGVRADNRTLSGTSTGNGGLSVSALSQSRGDINFNGYISSARVVTGSSVYDPSQTTITVPTSPLIAVSGTQALLSFTNGAIFDNAAVADYETVGNAQISTSVKKYGTGSMSFDGTGDYLVTAAKPTMTLGTGDFTVEFWMYANTPQPSTRTPLLSFGNGFTTNVWDIQLNNTSPSIVNQINVWAYNLNSAAVWLQGGPTIAASTWYHIAVCRNGSTFKLFVNGTQAATATSTASIDGNSTTLQWQVAYNSPDYFNGYIDDIRITKGVARYNYNFTPPTAEFPNIGGPFPTLTADPYYEYTTLLLPGNGTNGAQNNTFLDSSTNAFTITRNGNTTQGTFSPFSQTGWGNYFDGSDDYLSLADNAAFNYGSGDFTIEFWVYFNSTANQAILFKRSSVLADAYASVDISTTAASKMSYEFANSAGNGWAAQLTGAVTVTVGQWYHIAVVRNGTAASCYVNGTLDASTTLSSSIFNNSQTVTIGYDKYNGNDLSGYLSNLRIVKGTAVYTANFTPPTSPLTAITNTSLLTCQSNRFIDNSTNNFAITVNGTVTVQAFSPFNPTASWSAATYGGSGYFDGSGDYLQAGTNANLALGSGDFTIEGWHYCTGYNGGGGLYSTINTYPSSTGLLFYIDSIGRYTIDVNGTILQPAGTAVLNAWVHWAVVRNGSTLSIYINGTSIGSVSSSTNYTDQYAVIGRTGAGTNSNLFLGYLSSTRMVKGTAVYTANFTPPTVPVTAIANTQFLCNFTNAGIYDATSKNDLETVGNAQISTTQSKFGGSSMYFDGSGDWVNAPPTQNLEFGSGDFTFEFWLYPLDTTRRAIYHGSDGADWSIGIDWQSQKVCIWASSNGSSWNLINADGGGNGIGTITVPLNAWTHVAYVRSGTTWQTYINGVRDLNLTGISGSIVNRATYAKSIGKWFFTNGVGNPTMWNGYIDDLRITKGIARYTSNFTPPTTAFLTL